MVAVSPAPLDIELAVRPARPISRILNTILQWLTLFAGRLPGEYTVAKLDAFDRFRRNTSPRQLTGIFLLSPVACLAVNVLIESIPLADPATGFYGSLHFQIRNFLVGTIVMMTLITTKMSCMSRISARSWTYISGASVTLAVVAISTNAAIAVIGDVFPVPFSQFAPAGPMGVIGALINHRFLETPDNRARIQRIDRWLAMDLAPVLVYPIFTAVFMALEPQQQLWLSLLLPVLKLFLRYLLWLVIKDELDLVGAATCSVGHLYHILFTVMCLQNAKSLETYAAVVVVNSIQMLLNCRGILQDAYELGRAVEAIKDLAQLSSKDIISIVSWIAQQEQISRSLHRKIPSRLFSTYPEYQRGDYVTKYHNLLLSETYAISKNSRLANLKGRDQRQSSKRHSVPEAKRSSKTTLVEGFKDNLLKTDPSTISTRAASVAELSVVSVVKKNGVTCTQSPQAERIGQCEAFVRCFTSALHQTEIILLRSYITIFAMPFYGLYQALIFTLPNRKYFATMATTTTFDAVANMIYHMLVLCSLELVFLAIYIVLISRAKNDLDLVGSVTCSIGHFYHVLFTAMCLQNAKNLETLVAVVVVNFIHMLFNCREILQDGHRNSETKSRLELPSSDDIVSIALVIAQKDRVSRSLHRKSPSRLISLYPRYQTVEFLTKHREVITHRAAKDTTGQRNFSTQSTNSAPIVQSSAQVIPSCPTSKPSSARLGHNASWTQTGEAYASQQREEAFVRSVTSTLHQTEFILLRSYITIFGLSFYGVYLMLVFWLPNYRYFATMSVELVFFTVYLTIIRRNVGVSGIYQLGFVLWTQRVLIQGKFVMLSIMILGFPLEHYGNGFIFRLHSGT
ncbi:hypothetical protein PC129_g16316 [Phytophthora cactorum]|uniref:Uncharacterized protein n=2 Tax=Phytophthora cactorum TaxID=29920 RepID=A0A8T1L053_9STRA|nr:hypothetical protein PC117_g6625 [Phytophthora cactorum]KAG2986201.1 hypothetical protein PC119_g19987 [Phytophthora cactorum]KAG3141254.1 hypothetical protein C6341_g19816 [Phytophthora cactorum]KAG3163622.1 hypothetical protein PC128_g20352 [Phytophthora cactorum]KAG3212736.1 hypothetical protein PC129_g16316 [Phytophthora cactorum]